MSTDPGSIGKWIKQWFMIPVIRNLLGDHIARRIPGETIGSLELSHLEGGPRADTAWMDAAFSPDGHRVCVEVSGSGVAVWAVGESLPSWTIGPGADPEAEIYWATDNVRLALRSAETIEVYDVSAQKKLWTRAIVRNRFWISHYQSLAWSPDGARVASIEGGNALIIREGCSGDEIVRPSLEIKAGTALVDAVPEFLVETDRSQWREYIEDRMRDETPLESVLWSPDGAWLMVSISGLLGVVDTQTWALQWLLISIGNGASGTHRWSPDSRYLLARDSTDKMLMMSFTSVIEIETGQLVQHWLCGPWGRPAAWSPSGSYIALSDYSQGDRNKECQSTEELHVRDVRTGGMLCKLVHPSGAMLDVCWPTSDHQLLALRSDGRIWRWDIPIHSSVEGPAVRG